MSPGRNLGASDFLILLMKCSPEVSNPEASMPESGSRRQLFWGSDAIGGRIGSRFLRESTRTSKSGPYAHVVDGNSSFGALRIEVLDTGCGMTVEVTVKIFDPFYSAKFPGGVSTPGQGTAFQVLLPRTPKRASETCSTISFVRLCNGFRQA